MKRNVVLLAVAAVALLALAPSTAGCPVCYGESDDPIVKGARASILFMIIVTYGLLGSGVVTFLLLRRRARRLAAAAATPAFDAPNPSAIPASVTQGAIQP